LRILSCQISPQTIHLLPLPIVERTYEDDVVVDVLDLVLRVREGDGSVEVDGKEVLAERFLQPVQKCAAKSSDVGGQLIERDHRSPSNLSYAYVCLPGSFRHTVFLD